MTAPVTFRQNDLQSDFQSIHPAEGHQALQGITVFERAGLGRDLFETARLFEVVAGEPQKMERLFHLLGERIPNRRTRIFALQCMGFDHDTATGLDLRIGNRWKIFRDGQAVLYKRRPLSLTEAGRQLGQYAAELRAAAGQVAGVDLGELESGWRSTGKLKSGALKGASLVSDMATVRAGAVAGGIAGGTLCMVGEVIHDHRVEQVRMTAFLPGTSVDHLEQDRAALDKAYALNRVGLIASPLPFSATVLAVFDGLTGTAAKPGGRQDTCFHMLRESAGE